MIITTRLPRAVILLLLCGSVFLSGCATSKKTDFYQLEEGPNASLTGVEKGAVIGVGPVQLPEYLNRPQIVTRSSQHRLNVSEFNRWVEPLSDSIGRLLVVDLSNNLNSNRVYRVPRNNRDQALDLRVAIDFSRLDGELGKDIFLEARWTVFDKNNKPVLTKVSLINTAVKGQTYVALVEAMNESLLTLGREIAQACAAYL